MCVQLTNYIMCRITIPKSVCKYRLDTSCKETTHDLGPILKIFYIDNISKAYLSVDNLVYVFLFIPIMEYV